MASTASVAPVSTTAAAGAALDAIQANGVNKTTMKPAATTKSTDGPRKQSPVDGQRRAPAPKAWTSGTNPITQRGSTPVQQNGSASQPKQATTSKASPQKDSGLSDRHAHDRLTFVVGAAYGSIVSVTTKTGDKFEGVMSGASLQAAETKLTLQMTKKQNTSQSGQANGFISGEAAFVGTAPEYAMSFEYKDIAEISIPELTPAEPAKLANGTGSKFQTDTDISRNLNRSERTLQRWEPEAGDDVDLSLDSGSAQGWDQFETNKRMFGTVSTFDENEYTTTIDRSAPSYKRKEADAARIAREIEGSSATNTHMREERGQVLENDGEDEEDKYSGVRRNEKNFSPLNSGAPNTYTPPARRAPTGPGQTTVRGAPIDPAIISAQVSRPGSTKSAIPKPLAKGEESTTTETVTNNSNLGDGKEEASAALTPDPNDSQNASSKSRSINNSVSPQRNTIPENPTEGVENKVLDQFRKFANDEKMKLAERRRAAANNDRAAKLNDLMKFSTSFKLKTPIPSDLVGILAKDPAKQEQIIEKAKKEVEETKSAVASPVKASEPKVQRPAPTPKFDPSTIPPPLPTERPTFGGRGRGGQGFQPPTGRNERANQQQPGFGRGMPNQFQHRPNLPHDRKANIPHSTPAPLPIHDGRIPPLGPMAEQSGLSSPQRSSGHTPTSAVSTKFNVKAMEFRPTAPTFAPAAPPNAPSSPAVSSQRTRSISRTASPTAFFGIRKPKAAAERPLVNDRFNPIKKMKLDAQKKEAEQKETGDSKAGKYYQANGGIPNAFHTAPRWTDESHEHFHKTYAQAFERQATPAISPIQSRSNSTQHIAYPNQMPQHLQNGQNMPQISTPHRAPQHMHGSHYGHHQDEAHSRMPVGSPQVFPSPHVAPGQMVYPSPMAHPAQLAYNQQQYYGAQGNQAAMQMRQYHGTANYMHTQGGQLAAPQMAQQQSNGPYMNMQPGFNPQMQMYSPQPPNAYLQQNGYPSPGRGAPMMMHQGSQQGHHPGQGMMYPMQGPGAGPMMYQPQGGQMGSMSRYPSQQGHYASSPQQHQNHFPQQRAMSNGYGQMPKMMQQQHLQQNPGMPPGTPQHGGSYAVTEGGGEDSK